MCLSKGRYWGFHSVVIYIVVGRIILYQFMHGIVYKTVNILRNYFFVESSNLKFLIYLLRLGFDRWLLELIPQFIQICFCIQNLEDRQLQWPLCCHNNYYYSEIFPEGIVFSILLLRDFNKFEFLGSGGWAQNPILDLRMPYCL